MMLNLPFNAMLRRGQAGLSQRSGPSGRTRWSPWGPGRGWAVLFFCGMLVVSGFQRPTSGEEPAEAFLGELKNRGYHAMALEYLHRVETMQSVPAAFRERIDFERGEVFIPAALSERQLSRKQELLNKAQQAFEQFVQAHPDHELVVVARGRLASLQIEQARLLVQQSRRDATPAETQKLLQEEARGLLQRAATTYSEQQSQVRSQLEQIPRSLDPKKDAAKIKLRDELRAEYVQAQFAAAMALFEAAQSYPLDSKERSEGLKAAEQAFGKVAEKYRTRASGLYALLFQGRCHQELNDPRRALSFYEDLLTLPSNEPAIRPIMTKALVGAMECYLLPDLAQFEAARQKAEAWLEGQRPDERGQEDWTSVQWLLARTYQQLAESASGSERTEWTREARKMALDVAKSSGPYQAEAQAFVANSGTSNSAPSLSPDKMTTFGEALAAAKDGLAQRQVMARTLATLQQQLSQSPASDASAATRQQIEESEQQIREHEKFIGQLLVRAEQLTTEDTTVEEMNLVRFYRCALDYYQGDYLRSAVLAEFLATRYPATSAGQQAAPMALASFIQLLGDGQAPWSSAIRDRMQRTAQLIAARGAQHPEAADAISTLVTLELQRGQPEAAEKYLDQLPEDSAKRAIAELAVGQSLWNQAAGVKSEAMTAIRQRAIRRLEDGLRRLPADEVSPASVTATLLVAQYAIQEGNSKRAVELLDHPQRGPKMLADKGYPLLAQGELRQRTYATAVTAYISALPDLSDPAPMIAKALAVVDQLNQPQNGEDQGSARLTSTYVALAQSLQQQIDAAPAEKRASLVQAFDQFLDRAATTTKDFGVLTWIGESYVRLAEAGKSNSGNPATNDGARDQLYVKGLKTYEEILRRGSSQELKLSPQEKLLVQTRLALVYREMGRFQDAMDALANLLSEQENQVHLQMEAARTLQAWGDAGDPSAYERAIMGERSQPSTRRNLIWGFGRVARLAASVPALKDLFHEARYRLAECRYRQAQSQPDLLAKAEQDILMTAKLYPDLGGPERRADYDRLLKEIQKAQGKAAKGLPQ